MNKSNLIQLGAWAQKEFGMKDGFTIMEIASDDSHDKVRVAIPALSNLRPYSDHRLAVPADFEDVKLIKAGSQDNFEFAWCGYSHKANVLVIKEQTNY